MRLFGTIAVGVLGIVIGATCSFYYVLRQSGVTIPDNDCIKKYPLTNHALDCDTYENTSATLHELEGKLKTTLDAYVVQGKVARASIWVRDLTTFQWASVNDTERYAPASLMKLPLAITYYKLAEVDPSILTASILYEKKGKVSNETQYYEPSTKLQLGTSYTVKQLLERMIVDSDNDALSLLLSRIDAKIFENTLVELGIKIPGNIQNYDFITAKSYGALFRNLYQASYLDRESSQALLALLSRAAFVGIQKPLPALTVVADKFGERTFTSNEGVVKRELHDCGIIYKSHRPYTLCVMTEGKNFADLISFIQDVSLLTYNNL